jgi:hypothetical protein
VTYTITLPADVEPFKAVACDLVNTKVVDVTTADPDVKFNIVSASKNGSITGKTVTWPDLDRYTPGEPPIVLTVGLKVPSDSAAATSPTPPPPPLSWATARATPRPTPRP